VEVDFDQLAAGVAFARDVAAAFLGDYAAQFSLHVNAF